MRSADAFGASGVVVTGHSVDLFDPQVIRASAGAFFSLPFARLEETADVDAWFTRLEKDIAGLRIVGTSAKAQADLRDANLGPPCVLCFGNETVGLSAWLKSRCHTLVKIPMQGAASSLNLACAVTAVLYEATRRTAEGPL
jgi:TrmH family RNA methyltransferase